MRDKRNSTILPLFLILTFAVSVLVLQGQTSNETGSPQLIEKKQKDFRALIKSTFPVVDYSNDSSLEEGRNQKSDKYNRSFVTVTADISKDDESTLHLHWSQNLKALPVEESDVVVIGKVVNAQAHLSTNKKTVYSEFKIEIENTLKDKTAQKIKDEKYISVEREGGIVKYSSGFTLWHRVTGQNMPRVGSRYVFFLTNNFPIYGLYKQDFYLLTAYELKEGRIIPLDEPDDFHPIVIVYKGKEESVLMNDLKKALKQ